MTNIIPYAEREKEAHELLDRFEETSLFLLGNLTLYGPRLSDHPNSGNFELIVHKGKVRSVFCLSRRGNLILQTDRTSDFSEVIFDRCEQGQVDLLGIVGDWELATPLWERLTASGKLKPTYVSKERLYRFHLRDLSKQEPDPRVRFLRYEDFESWLELRIAMDDEEGIPTQLTVDEQRQVFLSSINMQQQWGLIIGDELVAKADLNGRSARIAQVGGVFTKPAYRRSGFARLLMEKLMADCKQIHNFEKMILFTGEHNVPASSLYESMGYEHIGHFGLLFGERATG